MKLILALLPASASCCALADSTLILGTVPESTTSEAGRQHMNRLRARPKEFAEPVAVRIDARALESNVIVGNVKGHEYRIVGTLKRDQGSDVWEIDRNGKPIVVRTHVADVWSSKFMGGDNLIVTRSAGRISGTLSLDKRDYLISGQGDYGVLVEVLRGEPRPLHPPYPSQAASAARPAPL